MADMEQIGSHWIRKSNGKRATLISVRDGGNRAVLRADDNVLHVVLAINGRPCGYDLVKREREIRGS